MSVQCPFCSGEFNPHAKRRRSLPAHNRYFAVIALAYANWPDTHRLKPLSAEDVRTFLQLRAGWGHQIHNPETGEVYLMPRSISFREMGHDEFLRLSERVGQILEQEIGISGDELLRRHKCAA